MNPVNDIVCNLLETPFSRWKDEDKKDVLNFERSTDIINIVLKRKDKKIGPRFSGSLLREKKISQMAPEYKTITRNVSHGKPSTSAGTSRKVPNQRDSPNIVRQQGNLVARKPKIIHSYGPSYPKQIRKSQMPGFSIGPRIPTKTVTTGPAPNSYNLPSCFDAKKGPIITGRPKSPTQIRVKNPAPCQYSLPEVKQYKQSATCSAVFNPKSKAPVTKPAVPAPKYYASPPLTGSKLATYIRPPRK